MPFGSCNLCLLSARDPVSCPDQGHLFCRECAISNLLAQSKEIKRLKKEAERRKAEEDLQTVLEHQEKQAKDLEQFEKLQSGLQADGGRKRKAVVGMEPDRETKRRTSDTGGSTSFWVPSQRPSDKDQQSEVKRHKEHSSCPVTLHERSHDLTLKTMVTVKFTETQARDGLTRTCPSCDKALSNTTKAVLAKPCGHVLCKSCSDKFQKPPDQSLRAPTDVDAQRCYVCQIDLNPVTANAGRGEKDKKEKIQRGLVELRSEGTGFAGGGNNMVKREGVAFQVG